MNLIGVGTFDRWPGGLRIFISKHHHPRLKKGEPHALCEGDDIYLGIDQYAVGCVIVGGVHESTLSGDVVLYNSVIIKVHKDNTYISVDSGNVFIEDPEEYHKEDYEEDCVRLTQEEKNSAKEDVANSTLANDHYQQRKESKMENDEDVKTKNEDEELTLDSIKERFGATARESSMAATLKDLIILHMHSGYRFDEALAISKFFMKSSSEEYAKQSASVKTPRQIRANEKVEKLKKMMKKKEEEKEKERLNTGYGKVTLNELQSLINKDFKENPSVDLLASMSASMSIKVGRIVEYLHNLHPAKSDDEVEYVKAQIGQLQYILCTVCSKLGWTIADAIKAGNDLFEEKHKYE